ncbi:hypothetical protein E4U43_002811 [Claviceps pusilla]|uniref:Uncharacterized protein n=1 Tax=Claviceps pusilla TaxID=123648 RepID=A0A9P7N6B0_9HYPO|nr:hypothetical protein E4U43_002811 [Claviceps pusilla]
MALTQRLESGTVSMKQRMLQALCSTSCSKGGRLETLRTAVPERPGFCATQRHAPGSRYGNGNVQTPPYADNGQTRNGVQRRERGWSCLSLEVLDAHAYE